MSEPPPSLERALFDELVDLPAGERERRLRERCGDDAALRGRLQRLFDVADEAAQAEGFLGAEHLQSMGEEDEGVAALAPLPRPFGHFRLVRVLGAGGMGLVYEAEQDHPKRSVALKVMRSDMVSRELVRRFRRETDTLARLEHPGIAHVYEAGSVADVALGGALVPYIAMELVRGRTLDDFARSAGRNARAIVALLGAICDAAQHAHERGVVHRDLKPANIIVVAAEGDRPQPKILDFGIARPVGSDAKRGAATFATSTGQILGTLAYMSPEQMSGEANAIDVRTDVYALGVILFELLTGRLPLDVRDLPIADAARMVRHDDATRLGSVDARLRGDLETIVAKALEKDPDRRYPSVAAMGADLRRFLADEPILAKPTTRVERVRRFARRNRALVWGMTSTIIALSIGVVVAVAFAINANAARRSAEWTSYRAGIAAASAALANHDVRSARQYLESTPEGLRGWEWRYLKGRLDQSVAQAPAKFDERLPVGQAEANLTAWTVMAVCASALPAEWPAACGMPAVAEPTPVAASGSASLVVTDQARRAEVWSQPTSTGPQLVVRRRSEDGRLTSSDVLAIEGFDGATLDVVALSPDATRVGAVLVRPDGARACWYSRVAAGPAATLDVRSHSGFSVALTLSDSGEVGLGAGPEGSPVVWRPERGEVTRLGGDEGVRAIAFSHDGTRVATGSQGSTLALFSIDGVPLESERRHVEGIQSVRFSPDDTALVTASQEGTIGLWSASRTPENLSLVAMLVGHAEEVQAADFSSDGRWIVSAARDGTIRAWPTGREGLFGDVQVTKSAFGQIDFDATGEVVVAESFFSVARMWSLARPTPALLAESPVWTDRERVLGMIACSPDASSVATIEYDCVPRIRTRVGAALEETWRGDDAMRAVGYTVDGEAIGLLVGDGSPFARLRRLPSNALVGLPLPRCASAGMTSTRDGRLLLVRDMIDERHHVAYVLDAATGAPRCSIPYGIGCGCALGELPNRRAVVAVAELEPDGDPDLVRDVIVRDAWTHERVATLRGHAAHTFSLAFTPDGRRLVSGGRDGMLRVWDTETWEEVVRLEGPGGYLWCLRFSPTGDVLVSGGSNGIYRFWRAPSGR
ncbi:MAG: serine/threonine-protein kinase [Phycisphaerales bacterium]